MNNPQEQTAINPETFSLLAHERLKQMAHFQAGFLGTASHELRAPINKIISLHQLILEDLCESPEEEREFLEQANQAIYQVLQNLDLLIQVSKLNIGAISPQLQTVSLESVLAKVHQLMTKKCLNRHCRLVIDSPSPNISVVTDSQWLQQLLMLLIDGAVVAGSVMINLSVFAEDASTAIIQLTSDISSRHWQEPTIDKTSLCSDLSTAELSPHFRYQLVTLMMPHLKGTVVCRGGHKDGTEIMIALPNAS